jgi:hypothetical protein
MRKPVAPVATDPPAAVHGVVVRRSLNVPDLPTISSIDLIEDRSPNRVPGPAGETTEKKEEIEGHRPKT